MPPTLPVAFEASDVLDAVVELAVALADVAAGDEDVLAPDAVLRVAEAAAALVEELFADAPAWLAVVPPEPVFAAPAAGASILAAIAELAAAGAVLPPSA